MPSRVKRLGLGVVVPVAVFAAAAWFLVDTVRRYWGTASRVDVFPAAAPLAAASVLATATYVFLILSWAGILPWWGERVPRRVALHMFCVSNLARFIPGMVWQLAGLAAMARSRGISAVATTSSVLLHQLVTLATGALLTAVSAILLPSVAFGPASTRALVIGSLAVLAGVMALPLARGIVQSVTARVFGEAIAWPHPRVAGVAAFAGRLTAGWVGNAVAFWLFSRSLLGPGSLNVLTAGSAYVASYLTGQLAVIAPGGIVVREAALVVILSRVVGGENALLLAVGSRVWFVALEVLTAAGVVGTRRWVRHA